MADKKTHKAQPKSRAKSGSKTRVSGVDARTVAVGAAAGLGAIAAIALGFLGLSRAGVGAAGAHKLGARDGDAEHPASDLAADAPPVGSRRAPEAFRPDPTAPVPESERESLRPATGPGPSMTAMRGEMANQTGAANG